MIYLIHGENQVDSRRALLKLKRSYQEVQTISGKNLKPKSLEKKSQEATDSLFGGKVAILIEGFGGDFDLLPKKSSSEIDLILWSSERVKQVPAKIKSLLFNDFKKLSVFKLADAIFFKNEKDAYIILSKLLEAKAPNEKIIGTLNRGFCLLYSLKEKEIKLLLPSFVYEKIKLQGKLWTKSSIKRALLALLSADLALKDGRKPQVAFTALINQVISL